MILIDTHIWLWWVSESEQFSQSFENSVRLHAQAGIGVSVFSCWEVAKLAELQKIELQIPVDVWMKQALAYPGVRLLPLTPEIVIESTQLPGQFHRDPADQILVATARVYDIPLLTADQKILNYPHVKQVIL